MSQKRTYEELQKQVEELKERVQKAEEFCKNVFEKNHSIMLLIHPKNGKILDANIAAREFYGYTKDELMDMTIMNINTLPEKKVSEKMQQAKQRKQKHFNFSHKLASGELKEVEVFSGPITVDKEEVLYSIVHDVSERRKHEKEREVLIGKLEQALTEIKTLRGILPICSSCKKIRDDKGYWNILETYIRHHSEAEFTHGICPECTQHLYQTMPRSNHD